MTRPKKTKTPTPPATPVAAPKIADIGPLMRRGAAKLRATGNAPDAARLELAAVEIGQLLRGDISAETFAAKWFGPATNANAAPTAPADRETETAETDIAKGDAE